MNMDELIVYIDNLKDEFSARSSEHTFGEVLVLRLIEHGVLRDEVVWEGENE